MLVQIVFFQKISFQIKIRHVRNNGYKNEIEYNNECSRLSETVSYKVDFMAYILHRDNKSAWELTLLL